MTNEKIMSTICDSICRHPYRVESQAELDILCEDCVVNKLEASDGDLISRADAIERIQGTGYAEQIKDNLIFILRLLPSASVEVGEWIPVKWHEITEEEREREGYPKDWVVHIDCEMPCDEEEILVQTKSGYIRWDVCYTDGEIYLDSGWDWIDDIVAWMPLPKPYEGGGDK